MSTVPADGYRINAAGVDLLRPGGDASVEADWFTVVGFGWNPAEGQPVLLMGPRDAPVEVSKTSAGSPSLAMSVPGGPSLPVLRSTSGVVAVPVATKTVQIDFGFTFNKVPRLSVMLDQQVTSQPYRLVVTKSYARVRFQNNFTGNIDWVVTEPA